LEWTTAWWDIFKERTWRPCILAAYEGSQLRGIAPLYSRGHSGHQPLPESIRFIGEEHADYQGFITCDSVRVSALLLEALLAAFPKRVMINFDQIPQSSSLEMTLRQRCASQPYTMLVSHATPCPWINLRDKPKVDRVFAKRSLRRHTSRIAKLGRLEVVHERDPSFARAMLPAFFDQHIRRWAGTGFPSLFERANNRHFYERLVDVLGEQGLVVFSRLAIGGRAAAFHFGLHSGSRFLWYKPTYEPALASYSPGEVLLGTLIRYALSESYGAFDFTRGDERFKSRFASDVAYNISYVRARNLQHAVTHRLRACARRTARFIRNSLFHPEGDAMNSLSSRAP
jgi:CelD/BcsL family acetyltransferase involved in cellulose biosynthesis